MTISRMAIAGAVLALSGTAILAESSKVSMPRPAGAFLDAYVHACQPVEYDFAGVMHNLDEEAKRIHDDLFLGEYGGSCRDFYFGEVVPRLDPERRPSVQAIKLWHSRRSASN